MHFCSFLDHKERKDYIQQCANLSVFHNVNVVVSFTILHSCLVSCCQLFWRFPPFCWSKVAMHAYTILYIRYRDKQEKILKKSWVLWKTSGCYKKSKRGVFPAFWNIAWKEAENPETYFCQCSKISPFPFFPSLGHLHVSKFGPWYPSTSGADVRIDKFLYEKRTSNAFVSRGTIGHRYLKMLVLKSIGHIHFTSQSFREQWVLI